MLKVNPRKNYDNDNPQPPLMLVIPHEEWQSLHEKLDRLTEIVERTHGSPSGSDWLESEEARRLLGVSPKTWQNYRDQRLIPFSQIGRKIYVNRTDLDTFLRNHRIGKDMDGPHPAVRYPHKSK